ncbi:MAG: hypothetical protein WCO45_12570 [Pseudanabaena sp. ELA607]|jgi:hypothetical protein
MTKFQFLLLSALITSAVCLLIGNRDGNPFEATFPIAVILAFAALANRYLSEKLWNQFARWMNHFSGQRLFHVRNKRKPPVPDQPKYLLPPSKLKRLP